MDNLTWWGWVRLVSLLVASPVVAMLGYRAFRHVRDDLTDYWVQLSRNQLTLQRIATQNELQKIKVLAPDENGRQGVVYDGKTYRNLDSLAVFTQAETLYLNPIKEQLDEMQRLLLAMRGVNAGNAGKLSDLAESAQPPLTWPTHVNLTDLYRHRRPSIHDLVVGVRPTTGGGLDVVRKSLHELMHVLLVGVTGKGKSVWLSSFLWQLARAPEPIEVLAIDVNGSEFNILCRWDKMRHPVARTTEEAVALMTQAVQPEIARRRELYEQHPLATKLDEYNEAVGASDLLSPLPPWVVVIDEGTNLLNKKGIGEPLREAVQTARQYGIYILLAGQSAHHAVINTQTRDNFPTRLCYRTSPTSMRTVLGQRPPAPLENEPGRAWAQLNGGDELIKLQGPFVERNAFYKLLQGNGPMHPMPETDANYSFHLENEDLDHRVREEWESLRNPTPTEITRRLFDGQDGGRNWTRVKESLERQDLT